jgi:hypothetical protein
VKHGCVQLGKDVFDIEHYPVWVCSRSWSDPCSQFCVYL